MRYVNPSLMLIGLGFDFYILVQNTLMNTFFSFTVFYVHSCCRATTVTSDNTSKREKLSLKKHNLGHHFDILFNVDIKELVFILKV